LQGKKKKKKKKKKKAKVEEGKIQSSSTTKINCVKKENEEE